MQNRALPCGQLTIFTARKRSCGKVMFLHLSVSHSVHRGGAVSQHEMGRGCTPPRQTPSLRQTHPLGRHPPRDGH